MCPRASSGWPAPAARWAAASSLCAGAGAPAGTEPLRLALVRLDDNSPQGRVVAAHGMEGAPATLPDTDAVRQVLGRLLERGQLGAMPELPKEFRKLAVASLLVPGGLGGQKDWTFDTGSFATGNRPMLEAMKHACQEIAR